MIATVRERPDVQDRRRRWALSRGGFRAERLVFVDETWAKTNMTPLRGWGTISQRLTASVPYGHWQTTTFLCGLRADGPVTPLVVDGAINGTLFLAWTRLQLAPVLRRRDMVVLDNLNAHKVARVQESIESVGAKIRSLLPYSPNPGPIEQFFTQLKHLVRKAGERTVEALWNRLGELLAHFPSPECRNYLRRCGYNRYT